MRPSPRARARAPSEKEALAVDARRVRESRRGAVGVWVSFCTLYA